VDVDLHLEPREPPETLFHGTTTAALESILETGLQRMKRHHVHLSADTETAHRVGSRHGKAVILRVDARSMSEAGFEFLRSDNGVWLVDEVPPQFLTVTV
jgi:putative RNA 2'-phosphotransferase